MRLTLSFFAVFLGLTTTPVFAEVLSSVTSSRGREARWSAMFSSSEVEYETTGDFDVERTILGVAMETPMTASLDLTAHAGMVLEAEYEGVQEDGQGLMFGAGGKAPFLLHPHFRLTGFGLFNYTYEKIGGDVDLKTTILDLHGGASAQLTRLDALYPYASLEFVFFSDGDLENGSEVDVERDNPLIMRIGTDIVLDDFVIQPELTLIGEKTLTISVGAAM